MLTIRMRLLGYFKRCFVVRREARGYVWSGKTPHVFLLMLVTFRPTAGEAAGIRDVVIPANANQPRIVAELWTPCSTPAPEMLIDRDGFPTTIRAVRNCVVTQKNLPLVLISYGMFEDRFSHHDTAEALADAGFAVVTLNHTEDSNQDIGGKSAADISSFLVRPIDIKRALNFLLASPPAGIKVDQHRIGFFGFSRGGYTGLVLAGAQPDFDHITIPCPENLLMCQQIREHKIPAHSSGYEPRITAYVIADPVDFFPSKSSLRDVRAPLQLWSSEYGGMGVRPEDVSALEMNLPVKPEFHRAIGAGHLSFDCPCSEDQVKANPPSVVCTDPKGFDRTAFHKRFDEEVVRFFREHLGPVHAITKPQ
jgi:predicted dienelactone hydrolase